MPQLKHAGRKQRAEFPLYHIFVLFRPTTNYMIFIHTGAIYFIMPTVVVVQSLSHVQLFAIPWIVTRQASPSLTISWSSPKFMPIESMMLSNHLILCCPLLLLPSIFPSIRVFPVSQLVTSDGQSIGASASASD